MGLETEGSLVRGMLESASWPCVCDHVVIWTECKGTHNQDATIVDFGHIHGNAYTLVEALVYGRLPVPKLKCTCENSSSGILDLIINGVWSDNQTAKDDFFRMNTDLLDIVFFSTDLNARDIP